MLYTAYLILCMASPLGGEYCTPAVQRMTFETERQCHTYLEQEVQYLKTEASLEEFRPYLPSLKAGKLKLKWTCSNPVEEDWLGRELPKYLMEAP